MKSPVIMNYWCDEIADLDHWYPDDPQFVDIWFHVAIGLAGELAADNFCVHLITQSQLSQVKNKEFTLVIPYFISWQDVLNRLQNSLGSCKDISWLGISEKIAKLYHWEYQG